MGDPDGNPVGTLDVGCVDGVDGTEVEGDMVGPLYLV